MVKVLFNLYQPIIYNLKQTFVYVNFRLVLETAEGRYVHTEGTVEVILNIRKRVALS